MALTAGIVGLPNVGKSTLFNAITRSKIEAANYPFATIEPNVGVVEVPDYRLEEITKLVKPQKKIPTTFEFTDIAGLVKGASKGEGLGNQFLANIRECDAIVQVVRCFENENIIHVEGSVDPIRDIEIINLELILSDLEQVTKRLQKAGKKATHGSTEEKIECAILEKMVSHLEQEKALRTLDLDKEELSIVKHMNFLTLKPLLYVGNVTEEDLVDINSNKHYSELCKHAEGEGAVTTFICAKIEEELVDLEEDEKSDFLNDLGITEPGLDRLIRLSYELLGLGTYFTAGEKEVRAWTFVKGMSAPQCAGIIHSDFERGFIRCEKYSFDNLVEYGSEKACKENGKLTSEGKEYIMQDGDIVHFLHNV